MAIYLDRCTLLIPQQQCVCYISSCDYSNHEMPGAHIGKLCLAKAKVNIKANTVNEEEAAAISLCILLRVTVPSAST